MTIPKEHQSTILRALAVNNFIYGILGDVLPDENGKQYRVEWQVIDNTISEILKGISNPDIKTTDDGEDVLTEEYLAMIGEDIWAYEDYAFFDHLCRRLAEKYPGAWLDFFYNEIGQNGLKNVNFTGKEPK